MGLEVTELLLNKIRECGRNAYPQECCGLLLGSLKEGRRLLLETLPVENSRDESKTTRYLIAPAALFGAEKAAREEGLDVIGVYHSHPDHPAFPSEYDREHALPWYSYIIVSVYNGRPLEIRSWILRDDKSGFDREEMLPCVEHR